MMSIWTVLAALPLAIEEGPAPEDVKAGWLGFSVWIALALAVVGLWFSLRKHLKRVDFEEEPDAPRAGDTTDTRDADGRTEGGS